MHDITNIWVWVGFSLFLVVALSLDTFFLNKNTLRRPSDSLQAALLWTFIWVSCALIFNGLLWLYLYKTQSLAVANEKGLSFLTGYIIEKSLSIDNLFVFYMIFHQFRIPQHYQQRAFAYGIWGAIIFRLLLILIGSWLIQHFNWLLYVMGAFLLLTGVKMMFVSHDEKNLSATQTFKWLKHYFRISNELHGQHFFIRKNGLLYATPLFIALIFIEISDLIFAFDSIPAIFAITTDPFIVWTSNIFAILGLRAMYFLLSGLVERLSLLKYGIAIILMFVGFKMVCEPWLHISTLLSLVIVIATLIIFAMLSLKYQKQGRK